MSIISHTDLVAAMLGGSPTARGMANIVRNRENFASLLGAALVLSPDEQSALALYASIRRAKDLIGAAFASPSAVPAKDLMQVPHDEDLTPDACLDAMREIQAFADNCVNDPDLFVVDGSPGAREMCRVHLRSASSAMHVAISTVAGWIAQNRA